MRLIDADTLNLWTTLRPYCSSDVCCEITSIVANAPTINPYEWISVEDRLPEKFTNVLCLYPEKSYGSNIVVDYMESDRGYFAEQFRYGEPTHWMPLPTIPPEIVNK